MNDPLKVGDEVCVVQHGWRHADPKTVGTGTVVRVGRIWAYVVTQLSSRPDRTIQVGIANLRMAPDQGRLEVHRSEAEYRAKIERYEAWEDFRNLVDSLYCAPGRVTTEQIRTMLAILNPPEDKA